MKKIYFSFSHDDLKAKEVVAALQKKLPDFGYESATPYNIGTGHNAFIAASEFIKQCLIVVAFINDNNPNVLFEVGYSFASGKKVFLVANPIGNLPLDLRTVVAIDYRNDTSEIVYEVLRQLDKQIDIYWDQDSITPTDITGILELRKEHPERFELISSQAFESALQDLFIKKGFIVESRKNDELPGFDFRVFDKNKSDSMLVEVKKYNPNNKISIASLQQLLGAMHAYQDTSALLIGTSDFTSSSLGFASSYGTELRIWTINELISFCETTVNPDTIDSVVSLTQYRSM